MPIIGPNMLPKIMEKVGGRDPASGASGDFTVGLLLGRPFDDVYENPFIIFDIVGFRGPPEEEVRATVRTVVTDGCSAKI